MYFTFQVIVTFAIIRQIWDAVEVDRKVILGLMSGYISLGLLSFFVFMTIFVIHPDSFQGLTIDTDRQGVTDELIYFSFITMMTIGYGDLLPASIMAKKASILIG